ncbi:MAG: hypothetical protein ACYSX0_09465 [Planctomycetota bacterium]|jgi:hypothetical protein
MKHHLLALLCCGVIAYAQEVPDELPPPEEGEKAEETGPSPIKLLSDLQMANASKDATQIGFLLKKIKELGQQSKDAAEVDPIAKELLTSAKICKGNQGTLIQILETMGELRSKVTAGALKKKAFKKKAKTIEDEAIQATAIVALCRLRDTKNINGVADMTKSRSNIVAKAAYEGFREYGSCKGKVRKNIATIIMKRMDAEYPSAGGQGSGKISGAQQERWGQLSPVIVKTMQVLCRQPTINDIDNWREWWREFKGDRKTWKDPKKPKGDT